MGKSCLSEISELMCATGGKITVKDHGQTVSMNKQNVKNADPKEQQNINPLFNYKEFQEEQDDDIEVFD